LKRRALQDEPIRPEVVDPLIERIAWLMDGSIRIGPYSIGLDGILGLLPGGGDFVGTLVSGVIVWRAMQAGLPKSAIARMVVNIGIDTLLGAIPLIGDLFDFVFKANIRNVEIYRTATARRREPARDWGFVLGIVLLFLAILAVPVLLVVWVVGQMSRHLPSWI
jgi:hypothetical protein